MAEKKNDTKAKKVGKTSKTSIEETKETKKKTQPRKTATKTSPAKKTEKKKEVVQKIVEVEEEKQKAKEVLPIEEKQEKKKVTIGGIIKLILLIITAPVWFPWKVLFVRRKGRKFNEVSSSVKVFRILRSPITKPLKFALFIFILFIEISCLYKIRYSPITYTITRASVHDYYLKSESDNKLLDFGYDVYAIDLNKHTEEFKTAFSYVDEWDLSEKNKMYVILDSKAMKYVFKYAADEDITYLLTRFNTEENLRNDIKDLVKNINKLINRGLSEATEMVPENSQEFKLLLAPFTTLGKALDYTVMLNTAGNMIELVESQSNPSTMKPNKKSDLDFMIDTIIKYSKGAKLKDFGDWDHEEEDLPNSNNNIIISQN